MQTRFSDESLVIASSSTAFGIAKILERLDIHDTAGLVRYAIRQG